MTISKLASGVLSGWNNSFRVDESRAEIIRPWVVISSPIDHNEDEVWVIGLVKDMTITSNHTRPRTRRSSSRIWLRPGARIT